MTTPSPPTLPCRAVVRSTRPGAKDPLTADPGDAADGPEYWAEPDLLLKAAEALEEAGFSVLATHRRGIDLSARIDVLERVFGARIEPRKTSDDQQMWVAVEAGNTLRHTLRAPKAGPLAALLWGLRLPDPPLARYAPKTRADYEADLNKSNYPWQTLPHQLRRELSEDGTVDPDG
ncbi:MAG: hypothetical protein AAF245_14165, partial [Pseudomonadota bacterium]